MYVRPHRPLTVRGELEVESDDVAEFDRLDGLAVLVAEEHLHLGFRLAPRTRDDLVAPVE